MHEELTPVPKAEEKEEEKEEEEEGEGDEDEEVDDDGNPIKKVKKVVVVKKVKGPRSASDKD